MYGSCTNITIGSVKRYCQNYGPTTTCCIGNALIFILTVIFVLGANELRYKGDRLGVKRDQYIPRVTKTKRIAKTTTITTNNRSGDGNTEAPQGSNVPREGPNDEFELMESDTANVANPQGNAEQDENFQVGEDVDIREPGSGATAPGIIAFPPTNDTTITTEHEEIGEDVIANEDVRKYGWLAGNFLFFLHVLRKVIPLAFIIVCITFAVSFTVIFNYQIFG